MAGTLAPRAAARRPAPGRATGAPRGPAPTAARRPTRSTRPAVPAAGGGGAAARARRRRARRGGRSGCASLRAGAAEALSVGGRERAPLGVARERAGRVQLGERARQAVEVPAARRRRQRWGAEPGTVEVEERGGRPSPGVVH